MTVLETLVVALRELLNVCAPEVGRESSVVIVTGLELSAIHMYFRVEESYLESGTVTVFCMILLQSERAAATCIVPREVPVTARAQLRWSAMA